MDTYRILTFDGGGVRGLITVILMQRLAREPGLKDWYKRADLYAGTSTGGLIALGMSHGIPLNTMRKLYEDKCARVFDDSWVDDVLDLFNVTGADYSNEFLESELKKWFGNTTIGGLEKRVLVTTFDLDNADDSSVKYSGTPKARKWKPKLFHNFVGTDTDARAPAYKVGLYTCAAPTYFPTVDGFVDGGVFANNPSMCALIQTQDPRNADPRDHPTLDQVALLSMGTGELLKYISGDNLDWGYAQWVKPLLSILMDGVAGISDFQCRQLLRDKYHRLQPQFPPGQDFKLDSVKPEEIQAMVEFAEGWDISETAAWLGQQWL